MSCSDMLLNQLRAFLVVCQGDVFMWIEILAAVITPRFKDYATRVADAWLSVRLKVWNTGRQ